jgi:hypothetical protein
MAQFHLETPTRRAERENVSCALHLEWDLAGSNDELRCPVIYPSLSAPNDAGTGESLVICRRQVLVINNLLGDQSQPVNRAKKHLNADIWRALPPVRESYGVLWIRPC